MDRQTVSDKRDELTFSLGVRLVPVLAFAGSLWLSGCEAPLEGDPAVLIAREDSVVLADNSSFTSDGGVVCDPFANNAAHPGSSLNLGLAGTLSYLTPDQPRYTSLGDYRDHAHVAPVSLFFSEVNVPTRAYDLPFVTQTGLEVKDPAGNSFYEYFAVNMEGNVQLKADDNEGLYQFALLADDGAQLHIDQGAGFETIIGDDGVHPTKMLCSNQPVVMNHATALPIKLDYFQGPRYHIALVLMWREWDGTSVESECGLSGNSRYFDSTVSPSTPKAAFTALQARGWKVLAAENFSLPSHIASNPCTNPDPLVTRVTGYLPSAVINNPSVTFTFESNYADATFECSLNGGEAVPCSSPKTYEGLADGAYTFRVNAVLGSERDPIGASHSWRIDLLPPMLTFISTTTTQTSIQIDWTTSEPTTAWVDWGSTPAAENLIPETSTYEDQHTVLLDALNPATVYYFYLNGRDLAGNSFRSNRFSSATRR